MLLLTEAPTVLPTSTGPCVCRKRHGLFLGSSKSISSWNNCVPLFSDSVKGVLRTAVKKTNQMKPDEILSFSSEQFLLIRAELPFRMNSILLLSIHCMEKIDLFQSLLCEFILIQPAARWESLVWSWVFVWHTKHVQWLFLSAKGFLIEMRRIRDLPLCSLV